jgi:putative endonuclease
MFTVYILYSPSSGKTYVGYTNDINRRLQEHNVTEAKGFTLRYRPWILIRVEEHNTKQEAIQREKYLKIGKGREEVKRFVALFLNNCGAVRNVILKLDYI